MVKFEQSVGPDGGDVGWGRGVGTTGTSTLGLVAFHADMPIMRWL